MDQKSSIPQISLQNFKFKEILSVNSTQKRVVVLGQIENQQGQAIMILSAKIPDQQIYKFTHIDKIFQNDIYARFDVVMEGNYQVQAIFPIADKHKSKYKEKKIILVKESAKQYEDRKEELLAKELLHVDWVNNIIDGKAETERILFREQKFIIVPDFKFSNLEEVENLHLLVIFVDKDLHSIRDLQGEHIGLLITIEESVNKILEEKFNLQEGACRMFFHYPPTFYQLHLHITNLRSQAANALAERGHLLQNVVANLSIDKNYYTKVTLMKTIEK